MISNSNVRAANLILNNSFESGVDLGGGIAQINAGQLNDWTLSNNTWAWYMSSTGGYGVAQDGSRFINLTSPYLEQGFAVNAGTQYQVSFYEALRADADANSNTATASISLAAGSATGTTSLLVNNLGKNSSAANYQLFSFSFTPDTSTTATLRFSLTSGFGYPVIDNISVVAVPEPASLALLGAGTALVVGITRRRRCK